MQISCVEKNEAENSVTIKFKEADLTLITPLMKELNEDKDVSLVRYIDEHPELCDRALYVKCKKGNPMDAIKKASNKISEYFSI